MTALRILVADDHSAIRRVICALLESHAPWVVCGEATNGREAIDQASRLMPDIAVLDLNMPGISGLEATRQILRVAPNTQIVILTTHESAELTDEVRRAGAQGIVSKSDAHGLVAMIESLGGNRIPIHLADSVVGSLRHVGVFFRSETERYQVLAPFVAEGLRNGEKALHVIEPPARELHLRRLGEAGVDVDGATSRRQLELLAWDEFYLRDGLFDHHAMVKRIEGVLNDARAEGFPLSRFVASMEWALEDRPGVGDLIEYEIRLNYTLPMFRDVVVCAYDVTKFSANTVVDVMRAHPALIVAGCLRENPFHGPPDQLLGELRRRSA